MTKGYKHASEEELQMILASYQQTRSTALTAQELNLPIRRVSGLLERRGIPLTKAHGGACYHHQAEIEEWAKEGVSLSEMARRIGTKGILVKKFLVEHGIEYKPFRQEMENNPAWRGGRRIDQDGYILVMSPGHPYADGHGYVREHRLVMEQVLGRYLLPSEVVHHGPGGKEDNRPENLKVYNSNAEHLAETLKGQVPQWTDEGKRRISQQKPRKLSEEAEGELQTILASYQRTQSTVLTAQELHIPRRRVTGILKHRGIALTAAKPVRKPHGVCYQHQVQLEQWTHEGVTIAEMARRIGATRTMVKKYLDLHELEYRTRRKQEAVFQASNHAQTSSPLASEKDDCLSPNIDGQMQESREISQPHLF